MGQIGGRGIPTKKDFLWVADEPNGIQTMCPRLSSTTGQTGAFGEYKIGQVVKRTLTIKTSNLPRVRDLLQQSATWSNEHIISRELTYAEGPWEHDNRDSVLEQGYETSDLPPQACCQNKDCTQGMPVVVSGIRNINDPTTSTTPEITQERYLDYFCPQCWSFENFRHNKDTVRSWSFLKASIEKGKKMGQDTSPNSLRGPLTDSEMQKVANFFLKIGKAPGPDNIQAEFIKTMPPEQLRVIRIWLNEILAAGKPLIRVTEEEMTGRLALLHKVGSKADLPSHWRPVVLLNCTNQLIAYIVNERLTEMVENAHILSQAQGAFRQNKSTDINGCKLF